MGEPAIEVVQEELRRLAHRDRRRRGSRSVFGATAHGYASVPQAPEDVALLEQVIGAPLPRGFREFLLTIGSGAGPYYGIYSVEEIKKELDVLRVEAEHVGVEPRRADHPFPISQGDAERAWRDRQSIEATVLLDGCLTVGHQGSGTQWSVLVIAGPLAGTMWDLGWFVGLDGEWVPARIPPTVRGGAQSSMIRIETPPTFLQWYSAWLRASLDALEA
jgi:hypothetical protein